MRRRVMRAGLALLCASPAGLAAPADAAEVEAGMSVYKSAAGCEFCHGWTGVGRVQYDAAASWMETGPSLVATKLDREKMIELVSCGTPDGRMPQYLATAWSEERRCYGKVAADLPAASRPPSPYSTMSLSQIEAVVSFVQEVYQGKGMTLAYCIKYYSPTSRSCDLLR